MMARMYRIKTSPKNYVRYYNEDEGTIRRTEDPSEAMTFASEGEARQWWADHAPTMPPLPPLGQGETLRLVDDAAGGLDPDPPPPPKKP